MTVHSQEEPVSPAEDIKIQESQKSLKMLELEKKVGKIFKIML